MAKTTTITIKSLMGAEVRLRISNEGAGILRAAKDDPLDSTIEVIIDDLRRIEDGDRDVYCRIIKQSGYAAQSVFATAMLEW